VTKKLFVMVVAVLVFKFFFLGKYAHANSGGEAKIPSRKKTKISSQQLALQSQIAVSDTKYTLAKKYSFLDPNKQVPLKALAQALEYFERHGDQFTNKNFISVIDYSKTSSKNRFHIIDMKSGQVTSLHVSHGRGSDQKHTGRALEFSNVPSSNATSLGYYLAAETYSGKHGYSLRLDGLSPTNSNARERAIVIHGADYVRDESVLQGRSFGCPAVSLAQRDFVINSLKGGSLIFVTN
jgi:hypothetical protein